VRSALAGVPSLMQTASDARRTQLEGIIASLKAEEEQLLTVGSKTRNMLVSEHISLYLLAFLALIFSLSGGKLEQ